MKKEVRQADIANALGVSIVTVSKALSGKSGVGPDLREKILEKAEEIGYTPPRPAAQNQSAGLNLALIHHEKFVEQNISFYSKLTQQLMVHAQKEGNFILSEVIPRNIEKDPALPRLISEGKADGLIILGNFSTNYLRFLSEHMSVPYILLDSYGRGIGSDAIISDGYYGAYTMTNYLFGLGHTKIAYVGTPLSTGSITDRLFGYEKALAEHGQTRRTDYIIEDRGADGIIYSADLLRLPSDMPTAFFCNCDTTASVLIRRLQSEGYRVPGDISVVGFDNFLAPGACDIAITSYEVDLDRMAKCAVNLISRKVRGVYYRKGLYIMEGHIVIRDSACSLN